MKKEWVLTQESFDALLAWLDPNRDVAAKKYETIRTRLIKIFSCRGCLEAEDLADETINRVTSKLPEIHETFSGEPARYFYGVGNKIHLEYSRRKPRSMPLEPAQENRDEVEREYQCLERCLDKLTPDSRELVLEYYREEKQAKIVHRRRLAEQLGIAVNALRIRAHRIRASLQDCVRNCVHAAAA
jgi:DNA-directed RNA polymerase specialized sigma24 family protein